MPISVTMPALSPTMETGTVSRWLVAVGDRVEPGDVIAEIETDKAVMEVEAADSGRIGALMVQANGDAVAVNAPIALLLEEGEDESALAAFAPPPPSPTISTPSASTQPVSSPTISGPSASTPPASGRPAPTPPASASAESPASASRPPRPTPLARRLAASKGIDLSRLAGSGPHGRIVKRDVEAAAPMLSSGLEGAASAPAAAAGGVAASVSAFYDPEHYTLRPHDGMRRAIASRLSESKRTIPHFYLTRDYRLDALLALRKEILDAESRREGEAARRISVNDFLIRALACALRDVPEANVSWSEEGMLCHHHSDIGFAVAIEGGLMTPIVRAAETKTLSAVAAETADLAAKARRRKLTPESYRGGSSSLSNLGMFGIRDFAAIVNPPQATILAVGAGERRPVIDDEGKVAAAVMMTATLSCDHRAVDGAVGARLLEALRLYIERPVTLLS